MVAVAKHAQSRGEEIANSVSHGLGLLAGLAACPLLIEEATRQGGTMGAITAGVFAFTACLLYAVSTIYHALPESRSKRVFQALDHGAIFLLIAGTYTPFTLGILHGVWGFTLFGVVWSLALVGIGLEAISEVRYPKLSLGLYLAMGWVVVVAIRPLWLLMPAEGLQWLVAGGVAYTAGVAFYTAKSIPYSHFVWHLFVLAGTACHAVAVMRFAA